MVDMLSTTTTGHTLPILMDILSLPLASCVKQKCTVNTNSSSKSLVPLSQFMIPRFMKKLVINFQYSPNRFYDFLHTMFFIWKLVYYDHIVSSTIYYFSATKGRFVCSNCCDSVTNDHFIIYLNKSFAKLQIYFAFVHKITDDVVLCSFAT